LEPAEIKNILARAAEGREFDVDLLKRLRDAGKKINLSEIMGYRKIPGTDDIVWIEVGTPGAGGGGWAHMLSSSSGQNHVREINRSFFNESATDLEVMDFILDKSIENFVPGARFSKEIDVDGKLLHLEIGSNGFIVTAYRYQP
jgi:hypothetical protein